MNTKRVFSLILTIIMLLSVVLPIDVFADELIDEGWEEFSEETVWEEQLVEENLLDGNNESELITEEELYEENQEQNLIEEEIVDESYSDKQENEILFEEGTPVVEEKIPAAEEESDDNSQPGNEEVALVDAETFAATLTVEVSPMEIEAEATETVEFEATVTGASGSVSYQWEYSTDGGQTWKDSAVSGNKTAKISLKAADARLTMLYRCKVTCGEKTAVSEGAHFVRPDSPFAWSVNADGTMTLVRYRENEATVVVPETYHDKTVTVIGESAFEGKNLTSIDLPDTITVIGKRAFADCTNLSEMK